MRLVLHIGSPKTGTTAIQHALFDAREPLRRAGVLYPGTGLVRKDEFGPRHKKLTHRYQDNEGRWERLFEEVDEAAPDVTVISCEGFWRYPERASALRERFARFPTTIVAGLRRQDRFLASWYLQRRRDGVSDDPEALFAELEAAFHYDLLLDQWEAAFGAESVKPFAYPEGGDVLPAFWTACGLPGASLPPGDRRNTTPQTWTPRSVLGDFADTIVRRFEERNRLLAARYGLGTSWLAELA